MLRPVCFLYSPRAQLRLLGKNEYRIIAVVDMKISHLVRPNFSLKAAARMLQFKLYADEQGQS